MTIQSPSLKEPLKTHYTKDELLASSMGTLFGPKSAKLPKPPMLMFDRITQIHTDGGAFGKGYLEAELDIHPDLWFFDCHFHQDPVMPGCLGLDALWQLNGFFLTHQQLPGYGRALGVGKVSFTGEIKPHETMITYRLDIKRVIKKSIAMSIADGTVSCNHQVIYTAENLKTGVITHD